MPHSSSGFALALALALASPSASASPPPPLCPAPPAETLSFKFPPGEALGYRLDVFGADVGTLDFALEPPPASERPRATALVRARMKTSAFVSSAMGATWGGFSTALLGRSLQALRWHEELDDGPVHRVHELDFPPRGPDTEVRASTDGRPETFTVPATLGARDLLSAVYVIRASPLAPGAPICIEIYAMRRMWRLAGAPAARETIDTPLGKLQTVRVDLVSTRVDEPQTRRALTVWLTDDARRLPVVAIAEVRGKLIRGQLVSVKGARGAKMGK